MLLKGLLSAAALLVGVTTSAGIMLNGTDTHDDKSGTLSLAPLSLGNPTTAATLTTLRTDLPNPTDTANINPGAITVPLKIGRGDTLAGLMTKAGVRNAEAQAAISALSKQFDPRRISKKHRISLTFQPPAAGTSAARNPALGRFTGLVIEPDYNTVFKVSKNANNRFTASKVEKTLNRVLVRTEGTIRSSLYLSGRKAGIPDRVLVELIRAYSWDVDFQRDIRAGDGFQVMFEKIYDDHGNHVHSGDIRYAALTLSGKRHAIYRHVTKDGTDDYFDEKGRSARKALMRTPIDGARLSSGFGKRRHPILGYKKMHRGIDFAAARGTPIYAAGNGFVVKSGRNGAYGNYVKIRHNNRYFTAYAHMRRIHKSARQGKRVKQGQIIGYVGTTGRSTGPHLH
ncbi:MAG: M23 family metallopeptidase, partial [Alphaproteobacteria bacterium]|nr:M23 family metallopeptidase [Alphaproteobacteria bacterium]